jgi:hypothetical protein
MSLAVICSTEVKPGMVWLYTKRTAETIAAFLKETTPASPPSPVPAPTETPS